MFGLALAMTRGTDAWGISAAGEVDVDAVSCRCMCAALSLSCRLVLSCVVVLLLLFRAECCVFSCAVLCMM